MSLIQRNTVPLFILLAVVAIGVGALLIRSPFAFGEEPLGCDASAVGASILAANEDGSVSVTTHGATLNYTVILSIPELPAGDTACNYGGGALSVILPSGQAVPVAGTPETGDIPTISTGNPYTAQSVTYLVNQADATNMELTAQAVYSGGVSLSVPEGEVPPEAAASVSNTIRIIPPSVGITLTPDTQTVYQGQEAVFNITVTNTGGFELSDVTVTDALAPDCDRTFPLLSVGASTQTYACAVIPNIFIINQAIVTAQVVGGVPEESSEVTANATASVNFGEVGVGIALAPDVQVIRTGTTATITITPSTPSATPLNDVTITVASVDANGVSADVPECALVVATVAADEEVPAYSCEPVLPVGRNLVTGTIVGTLPGTVESLPAASATVEVQVIAPGLAIVATSGAESIRGVPTVRLGLSSPLSIAVYNNGDSSLFNVSVASKTGFPEVVNCDRDLNNLGQIDAAESLTVQCATAALQELTQFVFTVTGTARDNSEELAESEPIAIDILDPSTAIGLAEHDTMVLRLIIQSLTVTETNDGDSPLRDVRVELRSGGVIPLSRDPLTRDSNEYVGGDRNNNSILDPGETWEWRVVTVSVAGDIVLLSGSAATLDLTAIGYGIDELDGEVTYPGDVDEIGTIEVPIVTQ